MFSIIDKSDCISLQNFSCIDNIHLIRIKYSTCARCSKYNILLIFGFFHRLINFCQKHSARNITNKFIYLRIWKRYIKLIEPKSFYVIWNFIWNEKRMSTFTKFVFWRKSIHIMFPWLNLNNAVQLFESLSVTMNFVVTMKNSNFLMLLQ